MRVKEVGRMQINGQYATMLNSLIQAPGGELFAKYVEATPQAQVSAVKSEIKALFELKYNGYLCSITAHQEARPDGLIAIVKDGQLYHGLVEIAHLECLFDSDHRVKKAINVALNTRKSLIFRKVLPEVNVFVEKKKEGVIIFGQKKDLTAKIITVYKRKRQQVRRYKTVPEVKLYYFEVNCAPPNLRSVKWDQILRELSEHDIMHVCCSYVREKNLCEVTFTLTRDSIGLPSLKNPFFIYP